MDRYVLTDALGNLVRFVLLPGQRFDTAGVAPLIAAIAGDVPALGRAESPADRSATDVFRRRCEPIRL